MSTAILTSETRLIPNAPRGPFLLSNEVLKKIYLPFSLRMESIFFGFSLKNFLMLNKFTFFFFNNFSLIKIFPIDVYFRLLFPL